MSSTKISNSKSKASPRKASRVAELPGMGERGKGFRPEGVSTHRHETGSMRDHVIAVLSRKGAKPMKCAAIYEAIVARGWQPGFGLTPVATLSTKLLALQRQGVVTKNENAEYSIVPEMQREKAKAAYLKAHPLPQIVVSAVGKPTVKASSKPAAKPSRKK